jgi:formylmethanofuran dehydrogenase subunit C
MEKVSKKEGEVQKGGASRRFNQYKDEEGKTVRQLDTDEDRIPIEKIEKLRRIFKRENNSRVLDHLDVSWEDNGMSVYLSFIADMYYERLYLSPDELTTLCVHLAEQDLIGELFPGMVVSAAINIDSQKELCLLMPATDYPIGYLLYLNSKNVRVIGDVGEHFGIMNNGIIRLEGDGGNNLGWGMSGGKIKVFGNVGFGLGYADAVSDENTSMKGGEIEVLGNARDHAGKALDGGSIIIRGNAGAHVGTEMKKGKIVIEGSALSVGGGNYDSYMTGGEIHINSGEPPEIGRIEGGKVYHKGTLIVDK